MTAAMPTDQYVRRVYSLAPLDLIRGGEPNAQSEYAAAQFDRWLTAHDAKVRTDTLAEASDWARVTSEKLGEGSYEHGPSAREADLSNRYGHASEWLAERATRITPTTEATK